MPHSLGSINSKPPNLPKTATSTKQTEESTKDQDLSFDTSDLQSDSDPFNNNKFLQENVALKLQLLTRTGMSTSRISLVSSTISRPSAVLSYQQSISSQLEELKSNDFLFPRFSASPQLKEVSYAEAFWKPDDDIRDGYLYRLKAGNILGSKHRRKHQSFAIIDWDGGLFCGSDLEELKEKASLGKGQALLKALDEMASSLLLKMIEYCETFIMTSYSETLVEYRARLFLPKTYSVIVEKHIQVISTRHYEPSDIRGSLLKKEGLFRIREKYHESLVTNMVCVVNSPAKVDMVSVLAKQFDGAILKIVKLKEYPNVNEVLKQQQLLLREFETMFYTLRSFTVQFSKKISKK